MNALELFAPCEVPRTRFGNGDTRNYYGKQNEFEQENSKNSYKALQG